VVLICSLLTLFLGAARVAHIYSAMMIVAKLELLKRSLYKTIIAAF